MKNYSDTIGNRTSGLPACSAVPQPSAPLVCLRFPSSHLILVFKPLVCTPFFLLPLYTSHIVSLALIQDPRLFTVHPFLLLSPEMFSEVSCLLQKCLIRPLTFYSLLIIPLVGMCKCEFLPRD